jgi:hypothetical protein
MQTIAQLLATLCCAVFSWAAIYITVVEHPARLEYGTAFVATVFAPSYRRAAIMQATLAGLGLLCSVVAWVLGAGVSWLIGGYSWGWSFPIRL